MDLQTHIMNETSTPKAVPVPTCTNAHPSRGPTSLEVDTAVGKEQHK